MLIKVSIEIDVNTEDVDIEDLRQDLVAEVIEQAIQNPQSFNFEPLEA